MNLFLFRRFVGLVGVCLLFAHLSQADEVTFGDIPREVVLKEFLPNIQDYSILKVLGLSSKSLKDLTARDELVLNQLKYPRSHHYNLGYSPSELLAVEKKIEDFFSKQSLEVLVQDDVNFKDHRALEIAIRMKLIQERISLPLMKGRKQPKTGPSTMTWKDSRYFRTYLAHEGIYELIFNKLDQLRQSTSGKKFLVTDAILSVQGELALRQGRYQSALKAFNYWTTPDRPALPKFLKKIAETMVMSGDESMRDSLSSLSEQCPETDEVEQDCLLAYAYRSFFDRDYQTSIEHLNLFITEFEPEWILGYLDYIKASMLKARAFERLGQRGEAIDVLKGLREFAWPLDSKLIEDELKRIQNEKTNPSE